jgi:hypothetical protein
MKNKVTWHFCECPDHVIVLCSPELLEHRKIALHFKLVGSKVCQTRPHFVGVMGYVPDITISEKVISYRNLWIKNVVF